MAVKDNLVVLSCPACGGKNKVAPGSHSIICCYCGTSYIVPVDIASRIQDSINRCPICHQNDRVEKVSAIISKEITHSQSMSVQTTYTTTKKGKIQSNITQVPYSIIQSSELAKKLNQPPITPEIGGVTRSIPKPFNLDKYESSGRWLKITSYVIFGVIGSCGLISLLSGSSEQSYSPVTAFICFLILGLIFAVPLWLLGNQRQSIRKHPDKISIKEQNYRSQIDSYNDALASNKAKQADYQRALQNWNNLYYCYRDDCVFVLGVGKSSPSSQFQNYLYEV